MVALASLTSVWLLQKVRCSVVLRHFFSVALAAVGLLERGSGLTPNNLPFSRPRSFFSVKVPLAVAIG